jgi:hypothetical protein
MTLVSIAAISLKSTVGKKDDLKGVRVRYWFIVFPSTENGMERWLEAVVTCLWSVEVAMLACQAWRLGGDERSVIATGLKRSP